MREHITQKFPNVIELVGSSIYVDVSVLTDSGKKWSMCVCTCMSHIKDMLIKTTVLTVLMCHWPSQRD